MLVRARGRRHPLASAGYHLGGGGGGVKVSGFEGKLGLIVLEFMGLAGGFVGFAKVIGFIGPFVFTGRGSAGRGGGEADWPQWRSTQ